MPLNPLAVAVPNELPEVPLVPPLLPILSKVYLTLSDVLLLMLSPSRGLEVPLKVPLVPPLLPIQSRVYLTLLSMLLLKVSLSKR